MKKNIDFNAPLWARKETIINAPIEKVWQQQTDIAKWPMWQSDITSARLEGPLEAGNIFQWKAKGLNIKSTLHTVQPTDKIGWTGRSLGMFAIHNWTFEKDENGTRVITEESLSGWFPHLLKLFDRAFLDKSLDRALQTLKQTTEKNS